MDIENPKKRVTNPELLLSEPRTKFFERQRSDGLLRLVVLILGRVKFGQHALMQDSRNWNATALLTVEHDVLAMLQTTQARANLITEPA
jgi:hypothetical protein